MRSAKLKEERLRTAIKLSPKQNPKLYENVLELAELLDALGKSEEADSYYNLGMKNKHRWKEAAQGAEVIERSQKERESAQQPKARRAILQEPVNERKESQQSTKAPYGQVRAQQQSDAQPSVANNAAETNASQSTSSSAQTSAQPLKEPVAPYRPKPLRTASSGLNGSSAEEVGALQKRSFQGTIPLESSRPEPKPFKSDLLGPRADRAPAEFNRELSARLEKLVLEHNPGEQVIMIESQPVSQYNPPAVRKRPDQQLFKPRGQVEADARRAEVRQKQQLQELEAEKLAREKGIREAEAAAAQQKRQETLRRSAQAQAHTPPRSSGKNESHPWKSGQEDAYSPWRPSRPAGAEREPRGEAGPVPLEGRHVLEIMGVKTTDSEGDIEAYLGKIHKFPIKPQIRWADNTHALLVFSDIESAMVALLQAPAEGRLWLRRYAEASPTCKEILSSELVPPMQRPQTTDIVVRRFIGQALQKKGLRNLEGEKNLKQQRRALLAEKEHKRQLIDSAWGDE